MKHYCDARGIEFAQLDRDTRLREVSNLGQHLMAEIGKLIPVLPVPLVATVLLERAGTPISEFELKSSVAALVKRLEAGGARIYLPRSDWDYAVTAGLRMLTERHLVAIQEGLFVVHENELSLVRYYANSIVHLI